VQLHFREYGAGNPVIILHGLFGSSDNWAPIARQLATQSNVRVLTPDLRNHGQSPHHPLFSVESLVDDLFEFIDTLNLDCPMVLGHSLGGKMLLHALLKRPGFCKKAIVADMGLRSYESSHENTEIFELMRRNDLSIYSSRKEVEALVTETVDDPRLQLLLLKNVHWKTQRILGWKINLEAIGNHFQELHQGITFPAKVSTETWFIRGSQSDYLNEEDFRLISSQFEQAPIVNIKNAGHWLHVDNATDFLESVKSILRDF
jgi:pimeloyl-ACP methyl ester carboxylesterase